MCPITHLSPTMVGKPGPQWMTVPSWTEVCAPIVIVPWSPRSTAPGQIEASAPMVTLPMMTASGETYAAGSIVGVR